MAKAEYKPRFGKDMRIKPDALPQTVKQMRACDSTGCKGEGAFRVPMGRDRLNDHYWFCLEHARAHNERWDYFQGMSEDQIQAFRIDAITGHRPTWPLGKRGARMRDGNDADLRAYRYSAFDDVAEKPRAPERRLLRPQLVALEMLGLEPSATLLEIKARYKELVKRYHPDANGGDRGAEERLKQVIKAYGVLRASGLT
jgi:DnaJ-domain-containing protein 1